MYLVPLVSRAVISFCDLSLITPFQFRIQGVWVLPSEEMVGLSIKIKEDFLRTSSNILEVDASQ